MPDNWNPLEMMDEMIDLICLAKSGLMPIDAVLAKAAQIRAEWVTRGLDFDLKSVDSPGIAPTWMKPLEKQLYETLHMLAKAYENALEIFYPGFSKKSFVLAEATDFMKQMTEGKT